MMLSEAIEIYLSWHSSMYHAASTVNDYRSFLGMFLRFVGDKPVSDLRLDDVERYRSSLVNHHLSQATVATYLRHVRAFLAFLAEHEYIDDKRLAGRIKLPRTPKKTLKIYSAAEVQLLFDSVPGSGWLRIRNQLLIALMLDSGLRQHELTLIQRSDISRDSSVLLVHGKGNKERYVPVGRLTGGLMAAYMQILPFQSDYLLLDRYGHQLTNNAVKLMISKTAETSNIKVSSHKLRHNFATNYIINQYQQQGSCDIFRLMYLMGHEDITTTRRYLHFANQLIASQSYISHLDGIDMLQLMIGVQNPEIKKEPETL